MKNILFITSIIMALFSSSCNSISSKKQELPILGEKEFIEGIDTDTVYHTIPFWSFQNQDGEYISKEDYQGKVYIADFFFTHCPSVCPKMLENMKYAQQQLKGENILFLSHTVDPKDDTVERLKWYAEKNNIDTQNWNFVTGEKQDLYELGVNGYLVSSQEDALAPGGFLHSEKFILVDTQGRIRGMYDGTQKEQVDKMINDARLLVNH